MLASHQGRPLKLALALDAGVGQRACIPHRFPFVGHGGHRRARGRSAGELRRDRVEYKVSISNIVIDIVI